MRMRYGNQYAKKIMFQILAYLVDLIRDHI